jgi:hypothetical protein
MALRPPSPTRGHHLSGTRQYRRDIRDRIPSGPRRMRSRGATAPTEAAPRQRPRLLLMACRRRDAGRRSPAPGTLGRTVLLATATRYRGHPGDDSERPRRTEPQGRRLHRKSWQTPPSAPRIGNDPRKSSETWPIPRCWTPRGGDDLADRQVGVRAPAARPSGEPRRMERTHQPRAGPALYDHSARNRLLCAFRRRGAPGSSRSHRCR